MEMTSKKVFELVEIFEKLPKTVFKSESLSMGTCNVFYGGQGEAKTCGTPRCHAGWFWFAKHLGKIQERIEETLDGNIFECSAYLAGLREFCSHFGCLEDYKNLIISNDWVSKSNAICSYFRKNPNIWGNKNGGSMFILERAFEDDVEMGVRTKRAGLAKELSLRHIVEHWGAVGMRLQTLELYEEGERHRR